MTKKSKQIEEGCVGEFEGRPTFRDKEGDLWRRKSANELEWRFNKDDGRWYADAIKQNGTWYWDDVPCEDSGLVIAADKALPPWIEPDMPKKSQTTAKEAKHREVAKDQRDQTAKPCKKLKEVPAPEEFSDSAPHMLAFKKLEGSADLVKAVLIIYARAQAAIAMTGAIRGAELVHSPDFRPEEALAALLYLVAQWHLRDATNKIRIGETSATAEDLLQGIFVIENPFTGKLAWKLP